MVSRRTFELLEDSRVNCFSFMTTLPVNEYLSMVDAAYKKRGGIIGQREQLRTTSAVRIRKRMVDDIVEGAVLPPIVIGIVLPRTEFKKIRQISKTALQQKVLAVEADRISIIDGMQRTTALLEASSARGNSISRHIRIEFWISESTSSLIYRMLVLNTGQVPWNLRRQIEVVFRSLILEIKARIQNLTVLETGDPKRRSKGGQFQADELVELFLVFGARKEKIDIRERLADEFTRLDFMEAASDQKFTSHFCETLRLLVILDIAFDEFKVKRSGDAGRFQNGKDLFSSQPACVGFITAVAMDVFGRPGVHRGEQEQERRLKQIVKNVESLATKLERLDAEGLGEYLSLTTLNEALARTRSTTSVGDMEREFFLKAFQVLIEENFSFERLDPCWRAY